MSTCHNVPEDARVLKKPDKILLMGNPNVGKSIFFTELTGIHAISSNYAGTTVNFMEGRFKAGREYTLIDVPGVYSLTSSSEAEAVAGRFMESGAEAIICVLDASNLERNLCLALELKQKNIPLIYALNLLDVAERQGISVNAALLSEELGAPVIPTIAVKKRGLDELVKQLEAVLTPRLTPRAEEATPEETAIRCDKCNSCPMTPSDIWAAAKAINRRVSSKNPSNPDLLDRLGRNMMKPMPGILIAILVILLTIGVVVGGGEGLRSLFLLPLVNNAIVPLFRNLFASIIPEGVWLNILVGEYGVFVISFEWILALIFPYVLLFYIVFTFLEDTGFLPRISVLFDNIMRKLGIQGGSLIHMMMGYGCAVPAILGSRAATSRKERIIISTAICFAIPCVSQTGALVSLLSAYAWWMLPVMILFSLLLFAATTLITGKLIKGSVDPLLLEVPTLLMPNPKTYGRKLLTRMKHFLYEAEVPMLIAVLVAALLAETGLLNIISVYAQPLVGTWLGMPPDAVMALILGIVRREMSVAPLLALNLTPLQAFVGGAVSLMYLPCLSVYAILTREFKTRVAISVSLATVIAALFVGGIINQFMKLFL